MIKLKCLNPLSTGRSFQTISLAREEGAEIVLIPYQQGGLFRPTFQWVIGGRSCLNPLSTGRSFQTLDPLDIAPSA